MQISLLLMRQIAAISDSADGICRCHLVKTGLNVPEGTGLLYSMGIAVECTLYFCF